MHENCLKAAFYTLGCKLNFAETSAIERELSERGIMRAARGDTPDIIVINTCSVTETADKKGRQLIRRLSLRYPDATILVTGCYAQLKPKEIADMKGVDIVLGSNEKMKAAEYIDSWIKNHNKKIDVTPFRDIESFTPTCERGDRTRFFLKVQDGCDYFCTYCTIPFARGKSRSGSIEQLCSLAQNASKEGAKEIVITGVNIGDFGKNTGETFFDLIKALDTIDGIDRYRISSIEPNLLTEEIIEWVALKSHRFMPHFHIPLQSGSDNVLKKMNRHYDTSLFASRINMINRLIPDAFIGVDVIAGARGETETEWEKSVSFISGLDITRLHVFPYSERPGTAALALGDAVPNALRHKRVKILTDISDKKLCDFYNRHLGQTAEVLWEQPARGAVMMHGFTKNYIRVTVPYDKNLINGLSKVKLTKVDPDDPDSLLAEILYS